MKKLIALALMVLMVVPFGIISVSADAVPAEPVATSNAYVYTAYDYDENKAYPKANTANDGATLQTIYQTSAFSAWKSMFEAKTPESTHGAAGALKDGGYFVIVGKALAGLGTNWNYEGVIPATTAPLVITGKDPNTNASYVSQKDGAIYYMNESGANAGQFGMFMMDSGSTTQSNTLIFEGDVIFKDTVILNRTNKKLADEGRLAPTISAKGKIVIDSSVQFASMLGEQKYVLDVQAGAYAYLHAAGFGKYTGRGTIVLDRALVESGAVTRDTFADFSGTIVAQDGSDPFAPAQPENPGTTPDQPVDPQPPVVEPDDPADNPDTGDMTFAVIAIALASVAGAVLTLKKRSVR